MYKFLALVALFSFATACTTDSADDVVVGRASGAQGAERSAALTPLAAGAGAARVGVPGFANLPDHGKLLAYPARQVARRDGAYTWHRANLSETHALAAVASKRLELTTPSGERLSFRYERDIEHASGDWTWIGRLDGTRDGPEAILTFGPKAVFGSIPQPGKEPLRLTTRDGASWLVETDPRLVAGIDNAATRPRKADFKIPPKRAGAGAGAGAATGGSSMQAASATMAHAGTNATAVVDVILGYTQGYAASLGGQSQAVTRLNFLVDVTNQSYVNSQVDAQVRLVRALQVDYPDATPNDTALEELTGFRAPSTRTTPAAAFTALRAARDQYGADLVSLVRKFNNPENDGCGVAWLIGGGRSSIDSSDEYFGYSVVSDGTDVGTDGKTYFCRDETLAHEFGHNMGSQHDRESATIDGSLNYGLFSYSFGYKTGAGSGDFYTVMAYGDSGQTRYRTFSNPRTTYCGGLACGIADQADNARSLGQAIPSVATFRATVVAPPSNVRVRDDINGDGRSDLILRSKDNATLAYWLMNGAQVAGTASWAVGPQWRVATIADFSGDGRADVLWTNDVQLVLWTSNGVSFDATVVQNSPVGWQVAGSGDVNGDGKSDLILRSNDNTTMAYWLMNGAQVVNVSASASVASQWRIAAIADFNGDGKDDLVWSNDSQLVMWTSNGTSFDGAVVPNSPAGWKIAGSGDMDGNGKSDLVLRSNDNATVGYWLMNGPQVVGTASWAVGSQWRIGTIADFNGDAKADLVWTSDTQLVLWTGNGVAFDAAVVQNSPSGWNVINARVTQRFVARNDINGDGKADLVLRSKDNATTGYWLMSSAQVVGTWSTSVGAQWRVAAVADFNGDGKADPVWTNDAQLVLWTSNGASFDAAVVQNSPAGWKIVGAGDVNGDGKSDLILRSNDNSTVAYWLMNGAQVLGTSSWPVGSAWRIATVADFNGDARADLVWTNDSQLVLWTSNGTSFDAAAIQNSPAGWKVVGAGDINGDGKSDLILRSNDNSLARSWLMNGVQVAGISSWAVGPQWNVASVADFSGDGKADLMWSDASQLVLWTSNGTAFDGAVVANNHSAWNLFSGQ